MFAVRYVYLAALAVWLGGMAVLGGVAAPATFQVLESRDPAAGRMLAGAVFGEVLRRFHFLAYGAGAVMFICLLFMAVLGPRPAGFRVRLFVVVGMLALTVYSGIPLTRQITTLRDNIGGVVRALPDDDPRKAQFGRLHGLSTMIMLINVAGALFLLSREVDRS
jgi:uncharacterized protein DUF4149